MRPRLRSSIPLVAALTLLCFSLRDAAGQPVGERQGRQGAFISVNARAAALGNASGAVLGGIEGESSNPAVLAWLRAFQVEYTFHRLDPDVSLQHLASGFRLGPSSALGLHVDLLHYGGMDFLSRSDIRARGFELDAGASWSMMLTDDLAGGLTVGALNATTDIDPVWAFSADAGFTYMPGRYHSFGLALRGFGTDYRIANPVVAPGTPDPRPARALSLSAVFDFPIDPNGQRLLLAFENDKMIGRSEILYKAGMEYQPVSWIALRGGIQVRGMDASPAGGLGLLLAPLNVDYAFRYHRGTPPAHVVTLSYVSD